ncbi:MAG TPA: hypothetical protein VJ843_03730 [Candidatus Saccharimonadales bacterium]|nr:hypothetical protein [Candidatus Saccharimonadales bacterium]
MKQFRNCVLTAVLVALGVQIIRVDIQDHVRFAHTLCVVGFFATAVWFAIAALSGSQYITRVCRYSGSANLGMAVGVYVALNMFH